MASAIATDHAQQWRVPGADEPADGSKWPWLSAGEASTASIGLPAGTSIREGQVPPRISGYARLRMRQRHIPEFVVQAVYAEPGGIDRVTATGAPDREIRWRLYDDQRVEIVVDLVDDTIVSAWHMGVEI